MSNSTTKLVFNAQTQKLLIEHLISSKDLYGRTSSILKPSYFDPEYRKVMVFIHAYYQAYSSLPAPELIKSEYDVDLSTRSLKHNEFAFWCSECESFAKRSAFKEALAMSAADFQNGDYGVIMDRVADAQKISLDRDIGIDLYDNPQLALINCLENLEFISTGIAELDAKLGGGLVRQQTTMFSANSGVGKSVIMSNVGDNIARNGYHVLYLSLELPQNMIYTRLSAISTGENIKTWRTNINQIANKLNSIKEKGVGSYIIKRIPNGGCANDFRAYLKLYELEFERLPDVILVDYLDQMHPNGGVKGLSVSEQDKLKSEQLYEIGIEFNAAIVTASQQNRSGITESQPNQTVIAGGFTKINIMDNYISLKMDDMMRIQGIMLLHFLKTRSSDAVGTSIPLQFNSSNLQITDIRPNDKARIEQMLTKLTKSSDNKQKTYTNNKQHDNISNDDYEVSEKEKLIKNIEDGFVNI